MPLEYKLDWEDARQRYRAWWNHEAIDRCAISVTAPRDDAPGDPLPSPPRKTENRWLDFDYLQAVNEHTWRRTFYGGEAFPVWSTGHPGWGFIAVYLGAPLSLAESTGWVDPIIQKGNLTDHDYQDLVINPNNRWWQFAQKVTAFGAEQARGRAIPSIPALGGSGDTLAAIRGNEKLLFDLTDCPDYVREIELYLMKQWKMVYDNFHEITRETAAGSTCWFRLWSPGKFYAVQNDFSYMISPRMFQDIFMPAIEMQTNVLDHAVYHVDGVDAFVHVKTLCELPRLQAFQILPGAGKPSPLHYLDTLKQVQAAGRNLHITIPAEEVETALKLLSARGLFIDTWCKIEAEARNLLKNTEQWSKDR